MQKTRVLPLPDQVRKLWIAQQALEQYYSWTKLKFTLDGRLVGDIAEALALEWFDLKRTGTRTGGVDALLNDKIGTVQIKATGRDRSGPAFTPGAGRADHLLFFRLDFNTQTAEIAYNGPEAPVRDLLPRGKWTGTKVIALAEIRKLNTKVKTGETLKLRSAPHRVDLAKDGTTD
jgi:hypothetical protein